MPFLKIDGMAYRYEKFSGNTPEITTTRRIGRILNAFVHFVFELSKGELVYADLQGLIPELLYKPLSDSHAAGTPGFINNMDGYYLFDPMVHTPEG